MKQFQSAVLATALTLTSMMAGFSLTISAAHATQLKIPITSIAQYDVMTMNTLYDEAVAGDPSSQFHLARRLKKGVGVTQDVVAAFKWYVIAAEQGAVPAQLNLGLMYVLGEGVVADEVKARYWLEKAASSGDNRASFFLAISNEKQDKLVDAYKWYDLASRDNTLSEPIKNRARGKIGQLAMNLSSEDINKAHGLAERWIQTHEKPYIQ